MLDPLSRAGAGAAAAAAKLSYQLHRLQCYGTMKRVLCKLLARKWTASVCHRAFGATCIGTASGPVLKQ